MQALVIKPLYECLAETHHSAEHWLWCMLCERFFHLSAVAQGDACPFADCTGHGFDFQLFFWDSHREPEDPRWPKSAAELRHGMRSPDWESFYEARLEARILSLTREFEESPECRELVGGAPRYLRPFVTMFSDFTWDLTEDVGYFDDDLTLELLQDLPVWAETADLAEAPRMLEELRALYAFAERTGRLAQAEAWRRLLAGDGIAAMFEHTMRTDGRLHPVPLRRQPATGARTETRPESRG